MFIGTDTGGYRRDGYLGKKADVTQKPQWHCIVVFLSCHWVISVLEFALGTCPIMNRIALPFHFM